MTGPLGPPGPSLPGAPFPHPARSSSDTSIAAVRICFRMGNSLCSSIDTRVPAGNGRAGVQPPLVNSFGFATQVGNPADKRAAAFDQRRSLRPATGARERDARFGGNHLSRKEIMVGVARIELATP